MYVLSDENMPTTQASVIVKFQRKHGTLYDYSTVTYVHYDTKIKIKCKTHGVFEQTPHAHLRGKGCQKCACNRNGVLRSTAASTSNNLVMLQPAIASEWHPVLNTFSACDVSVSSNRKVWWVCHTCQHEWEASVNNRTRKMGGSCSACSHKMLASNKWNSLAALNPKTASEWHPYLNACRTIDVLPSCSLVAWWLCSVCGHEWRASVNTRSSSSGQSKSGCPACTNQVVHMDGRNSLATLFPKVAASWHSTLNGELTPSDVMPKSTCQKIYWLCHTCGHVWLTTPASRTDNRYHGNGCAMCAGQLVRPDGSNTLLARYPEVAITWHPTLNKFGPDECTYASNKRVWWVCKECLGVWEAQICFRSIGGNGCPVCNHKTEKKLFLWLCQKIQVEREVRFYWCVMLCALARFDFVISEHKLIIELDGLQHYNQVRNWLPPCEQYKRDVHKMTCAMQNGWTIIRLLQPSVWYDKHDWQTKLEGKLYKHAFPTCYTIWAGKP